MAGKLFGARKILFTLSVPAGAVMFFCLLLVACARTGQELPDQYELVVHDAAFNGKVVFKKLASTNGFKLLLHNNLGETLDQIVFTYTPYRLDVADVNRDGSTEILVGLIKSTEFDPVEKKRLFILRVDEDQLRPLWLGSRVCQELVDFKSKGDGVIQTLEKNKNGRYAVGDYEWQSFGLTLIQYTHNEISFDEALQVFENKR